MALPKCAVGASAGAAPGLPWPCAEQGALCWPLAGPFLRWGLGLSSSGTPHLWHDLWEPWFQSWPGCSPWGQGGGGEQPPPRPWATCGFSCRPSSFRWWCGCYSTGCWCSCTPTFASWPRPARRSPTPGRTRSPSLPGSAAAASARPMLSALAPQVGAPCPGRLCGGWGGWEGTWAWWQDPDVGTVGRERGTFPRLHMCTHTRPLCGPLGPPTGSLCPLLSLLRRRQETPLPGLPATLCLWAPEQGLVQARSSLGSEPISHRPWEGGWARWAGACEGTRTLTVTSWQSRCGRRVRPKDAVHCQAPGALGSPRLGGHEGLELD